MIQTVFILGRPGSGKSTTSKYLTAGLQQGRDFHVLTGFPFLQRLFRHPAYTSWFQPHPRHEFVVTNDQAYSHIDEQKAYQASLLQAAYGSRGTQHFLFIDLSMGNYEDQILLYEPALRQQALVLHLAVPYEVCMERVRERADGLGDPDDTHSLPMQFLVRHAGTEQLPGPHIIAPERFITIDNTGSRAALYRQLDQVAQRLFATREESEVNS